MSLGLAICGRFDFRELIPDWITQVIAGLCEAAVLYAIASGAPNFAPEAFASDRYDALSPG